MKPPPLFKPSFRAARPADAPVLLEMMEDFYRHEGIPFHRQQCRQALQRLLLNRALGRIWLLQIQKSSVGYAALCLGYSLEFRGHTAFLDELYVRPEWRGYGFGRAFLPFLIDTSRRAGLSALHLEVDFLNTKAHDLYRRAGFQTHQRYLLTRLLKTRL